MRIEQLRMQAFGPYVQQQVIDFSQLQDHLFLIRGETGAGKTAILDAITYAIYGYSSGGDRGEFESMRCRIAKADTPTFVECIICINHHRYRFYRQIEVHKKRNEELALKVKIDAGELLEDGYHPFFENCKQRAIEEKAQQLIGLSHAQFIQVMMLPQGKFEQLLISSSEAKQEILKSLFQVEKWEDVCERLSEKLKIEKDDMEQIRVQIQMLLQQSQVASIEDFHEKVKGVKEHYDHETRVMTQVHQHYQDALQQLQEQTQYHALMKRYDACCEEAKKLALQKNEMQALAKRVQNYTQFLQIKPYYDAMKQSELRLQKRLQYIQEVKGKETTLKIEQEHLQQEARRLESGKFDYENKKETYPSLLEEYERFTQREQYEKEHKIFSKSLVEEKVKLANIQRKISQSREAHDILVKENKELEDILRTYPESLRQEQRYATALQHHEQCIALTLQIHQHKEAADKVQEQLLICKEMESICSEEHESMYQHFLDHSAELLAQSLVEGNPCPVCGSTHHPSSTHIQVERDVVGKLRQCKEALTKAQEQTQKAYELVQIEQSQLQVLSEQVETSQRQIRVVLANGYDRQVHEQLQAICKQGEQQMQQRLKNVKNIETHLQTLQTLEEAFMHVQETCHAYEQKIIILQTKLEERNITHTYKDSVQLQAYIQEQKNAMDVFEQSLFQHQQATQETSKAYAIVLSSLEAAKKEHMNEEGLFQKAKEAYDMQQLQLPQDVVFEEMDVFKEKENIKHYEQRCIEVESAKQQIGSQLEHRERKDLSLIQTQVEQAQVAYQSSTRSLAMYESELKALQRNEKQAVNLQKKWELALGTYEKLQAFVKAMRGDNSIGIERYVLGVMLSQITQVANRMLQHVHNGRYQIYRSDETSGRVRKFGLELSIYDTYSCSQRSVVSLSGGEKFLVSLALSLALSTVVQARSGGIYLETMFIDEGFGSLDEQSIADALQVLSSMGKQKAMIGIISHVELLKENIPYGIQVKKQRIGSSLTLLN